MKRYNKYKALFVSKRIPREDMGLNVFNFLYSIGMAHCVSMVEASNYLKEFLEGEHFHRVMTECPNFPYDTITIQVTGNDCATKVTSLDKLHLNPWVSTSKTFQVLSPEVVMLLLCKKHRL